MMKVAAGTRLGPYEIVAPIGAGGMGEVYRARDTRLDRSVAVKILPAEFAGNAQLRARFEQEAKAISQLNHPNICVLHDVGDNYLVMELLEGESLSDRISRGTLPLDQVMRIGAEIASALDRAHSAGVVHRDLKPGNVMLTKSGAKLLDFGLAKSATINLNAEDATVQKPLTQEGTILGTFQYMSPEQLEGQPADHRTDIFALGALLYEMATGRRAFDGATKTSIIAAIVSGEPRSISEIQPLTPAAFEHVVKKCLAKDPEDRWQSARDVAEELRWIAEAGSKAGVAAPIVRARRMRIRWITSAAIAGWLAAGGVAALAIVTARRLTDARQPKHAELAVRLSPPDLAQLAVSPRGDRIVAVVGPNETTRLWLRDLHSDEGRILAGTEGGTYPFWSPDGSSIGFFAGGKLKTLNLATGAVQVLCDAPFGRGGSWSSAGTIVFAPNISTSLVRVDENGGTPVAVTKAPPGITHRNPAFLPDGIHFLYSSGLATGVNGHLQAGSLDGKVDRSVLPYASNVAYVDGWLLTVRDHNLMAQRFDERTLSVHAKSIVVAQNVDEYPARYQSVHSAAGDTLAYNRAAEPQRQFVLLDRGSDRPVALPGTEYVDLPSISPDGRRVIINRYDRAAGRGDLWLYELDGSSKTRLTFDGQGMESTAVFSPDGQRVVVCLWNNSNNLRVYIQPVGGGAHDAVLESPDFVRLEEWTTANELILTPQRERTGEDVGVIRLDGSRKLETLVQSQASERCGHVSPNRKWLAYQSDESGRPEIYVTTWPVSAAKWQVSTTGGARPFWSGDGKQIYFLAGSHVVAADVHEGASFSADPPKPVEALGDHIADFAVARNGRIVALREIDPGNAPLTIVFNWRSQLPKE